MTQPPSLRAVTNRQSVMFSSIAAPAAPHARAPQPQRRRHARSNELKAVARGNASDNGRQSQGSSACAEGCKRCRLSCVHSCCCVHIEGAHCSRQVPQRAVRRAFNFLQVRLIPAPILHRLATTTLPNHVISSFSPGKPSLLAARMSLPSCRLKLPATTRARSSTWFPPPRSKSTMPPSLSQNTRRLQRTTRTKPCTTDRLPPHLRCLAIPLARTCSCRSTRAPRSTTTSARRFTRQRSTARLMLHPSSTRSSCCRCSCFAATFQPPTHRCSAASCAASCACASFALPSASLNSTPFAQILRHSQTSPLKLHPCRSPPISKSTQSAKSCLPPPASAPTRLLYVTTPSHLQKL